MISNRIKEFGNKRHNFHFNYAYFRLTFQKKYIHLVKYKYCVCIFQTRTYKYKYVYIYTHKHTNSTNMHICAIIAHIDICASNTNGSC